MSKNNIIGISGGHGQGKTTLVNALQKHPDLIGWDFKSGLTRSIKAAGQPINAEGTELTQLQVMTKHYEYAQLQGNVILDRCALDGLAYTQTVLENCQDTDFMFALGAIGTRCLDKYRLIFYVKPELVLEDDGTRSVDRVFFDKIIKNFGYWVGAVRKMYPDIPVVQLSGTVEERVNTVIKTLKEQKIIA